MAEKLTGAQCAARYQALSEAAAHLRMDWTDDALERAEGRVMADRLDAEALGWIKKAIDRGHSYE